MENRRELLRGARRIVLKVGSGALSGGGRGLDAAVLGRLGGELAHAVAWGRPARVVAPGGLLAGHERLVLAKGGPIQLRRGAAAVGQGRGRAAGPGALAPHGLAPAQVLLTQ